MLRLTLLQSLTLRSIERAARDQQTLQDQTGGDVMCAIDDADYFCEVLSSRTLTARKAHRCNECGRTIEPGESYLCEFLTDKEQGARVHKTCAHCQIVREWLLRECGGWLYSGIAEDIGDHAGYGMPVARLVVGINRQWYRIDGSLMPVPTLPQGAA